MARKFKKGDNVIIPAEGDLPGVIMDDNDAKGFEAYMVKTANGIVWAHSTDMEKQKRVKKNGGG